MKALLILVGALFAVWMWQRRRPKPGNTPKPPAATSAASPQAMVSCHACGLHLPQSEALTGPQGALYCSQAHLQQGR